MTASAKRKAIELLWIVGAAAVSLVVAAGAIELSANILGVAVNGVVETGLAVVAAVTGGGWAVYKRQKKEAGD